MTSTVTERVPGRAPVRVGPVSGVWRPRVVAVPLISLGLLAVVSALSIGRGDVQIPVGDVLAVLTGGGVRAQQFVVLELRLPRVAVGALVGAALGVAGALTQAVARNPLASPDVLGVTAGAGAAAVAVIALGGTSGVVGPLLAGVGLPVAAVIGGLGAAALAYALAWRHGLDGYRLVLVGIGIDAAATALIDWLLVITKVQDAARATVWLTGSLNGRGWEQVVPVAVALVVLVPAALLLSARVGVLQLGDDSARGLGLRVDRTRAALVVLASRSRRSRRRRPDRSRSSRSSSRRSACGSRTPHGPRCSRRRSGARCWWSPPTWWPGPCCRSSCRSGSSRPCSAPPICCSC